MIIGVPREIKNNEYRVAMVPAGVEMLTDEGHVVLVETGAGMGTGIEDIEYEAEGIQLIGQLAPRHHGPAGRGTGVNRDQDAP